MFIKPASFRTKLDEISEIIDEIVGTICCILTILMFLSVFYQVLGRYVFSGSIAWTEETARYCMIWLAFLGASMLIRSGENSSVTFLIDRLPKKTRWGLDLLIQAIMLLFMLIVFAVSVTQLQYSLSEFSPALRIRMFIPKSSILFGSLMISIQLLWKITDTLLAVKAEQKGG